MRTASWNEGLRAETSHRRLLRSAAIAALGMLIAVCAFGQGRCRDGYATQACPLAEQLATAPIQPVFASTGLRTVAIDHITFEMPDDQKEAAFYIAIMGW